MADNYPFNNDDNNNQNNQNSSSFIYENNSSPKKPKKHTGLKAVAFVLSMVVVGGGSVQVYKYMNADKIEVSDFDSNSNPESSRAVVQQSLPDSSVSENPENKDIPSLIDIAARADAKALPDIVDTIMPSVVGVASTFEYTPDYSSMGWGWGFGVPQQPETQELRGTGTGIVMSDDGYIITNAHVIYENEEYHCGEAVDVSVVFSDETEHDAKIIAYDIETDLAVLKVNETGLTPAQFGNSEDLRVGELVIAVGNPLGFDLFGSVTSGIVSAKNRKIDINEKSMTLIQTDAAINSGNSGGPLLNSSGQVIGINSAKMSSSYGSASIEGLGFAIPINEAKVIIDDLINYKYVKGRPQIGITTVDVTESVSRYYDIPLGVYVQSVQEGGAADLAGIQKGDVIIDADGETVTTADELNKVKNNHKAGETLSLTITRAGEDIKIDLILQEANADKGTPFDDETSVNEN